MKDYSQLSEQSKKSHQDDQLTPAGYNAIRGLGTNEGQPDPEMVKGIVPREQVGEPRKLNASETNDLELAAQRASGAKATRWHGETEKGIENEYYRIRSEIGEELAVNDIPNSIQSDPFSEAGTNFPNYDVFSTQEVSSVKVRAMKGDKPSTEYRKDFAELINPNSELNQKAAERLLVINQDEASWEQLSPHLPPTVRTEGSKVAIQSGLSEKATLRIPADQVCPVRADLGIAIASDPEKFGLSSDKPPEQLKDEIDQIVTSRVLPIDSRYDTAHYQVKAAEMIQDREELIQKRLS